MTPTRDVHWSTLIDAILQGRAAEIAGLRGRIDWSTIGQPEWLLGDVVPRMSGPPPAEARAAAVTLLRMALEEYDQGGKCLFDLDNFNPIANYIENDFSEALAVFLDAGFDPAQPCVRSQTAIEFARERNKPDIEVLLRSALARREAERALQDIRSSRCTEACPMTVVRDTPWSHVVDALENGAPDEIETLRGRIDWSTVKDPADELGTIAWINGDLAPIARAAAVALLRIAYEEFDDGGKCMFALEDCDQCATSFVNPIMHFIEADFPEAIAVFLEAGFDPAQVYGIDGLNAIDVAQEQDKPGILGLFRSHQARCAAEATVREIQKPQRSAP